MSEIALFLTEFLWNQALVDVFILSLSVFIDEKIEIPQKQCSM